MKSKNEISKLTLGADRKMLKNVSRKPQVKSLPYSGPSQSLNPDLIEMWWADLKLADTYKKPLIYLTAERKLSLEQYWLVDAWLKEYFTEVR